MPVLVELDYHKDGNEVHVGCVELEVDIRRTEMVAARHDPLHQQSYGQPVEEAVVERSSELFTLKAVKFLNCPIKSSFL